VRGFACLIDPGFERWIADHVAFPCSMVDRIVPASTAETYRLAASLTGERADHGATVGYDLIYAGPVDYGGWPPGRPYIPEGRYLYPTALEATSLLKRAGETAAEHEIRSMLWPKPTGL